MQKRSKTRRAAGALALGGLCVVASASGPDLFISNLGWFDGQVMRFGSIGGVSSYATGVFSCNIGDQPLPWNGESPNHPVMTQNMYRLKDGRFEQIGMSWAKHGLAVVAQQPSCGPCSDAGFFALGPGCMDPYNAAVNGEQERLGPRSEVNVSTGVFAHPHGSRGVTGDALFKRLRVSNADLDPAQNAGARWFLEAHHVAPQDAAAGNALNNASHRELAVGAFSAGGWSLSVQGPQRTGEPAIFAWRRLDPEVMISTVEVAGDGAFHLASRATERPGGGWAYDYALLNLNSHRSAASFALPAPGVAIAEAGFHLPAHHSGEPYDDALWSPAIGAGTVSWSTAPFETDPNANALRWSTMASFRFVANAPPVDVDATIGLFRPGSPASVTARAVGPTPSLPPADLNGDGAVGSADLALLLGAWGPCPALPAPCAADLDDDGQVGSVDLAAMLGSWG